MIPWKGFLFVGGDLGCLIYFLQMTVLFSVKQQPRNVRPYRRFYRFMSKFRGSSLIEQKPPYFFAATPLRKYRMRSSLNSGHK